MKTLTESLTSVTPDFHEAVKRKFVEAYIAMSSEGHLKELQAASQQEDGIYFDVTENAFKTL